MTAEHIKQLFWQHCEPYEEYLKDGSYRQSLVMTEKGFGVALNKAIDEAKPKWQYTKPNKPCLFVARYNEKDGHPSLHYAVYDGGVLCVADIEDNFVSTMEEYADCQYFIIEYFPELKEK